MSQYPIVKYMDQILGFYNKYLASEPKNKAIAISTAVLLSTYLVVNKLFFPPKELRHIPYETYYGIIQHFLKGGNFTENFDDFALPLINNFKKGIYMVPERGKWLVHVANPADAKYVLMKPGEL